MFYSDENKKEEKLNNFKEKINKYFKQNVIPLLTTGLIGIGTIVGPTSLNAADVNISFQGKSVNQQIDFNEFLEKNSLKRFDNKFLSENNLTPEQIYQMSKINLIMENAYNDNSQRFVLKATNLQKELLNSINSNKDNTPSLLTKIYNLEMGNTLLNKELNYEKKISILKDKFEEYNNLEEKHKSLTSDKVTIEQINNMKTKSNNLINNILSKNFENPELKDASQKIKLFTEVLKIKDDRINQINDKDKTMFLAILEKEFNTLENLEKQFIENKKEISFVENDELINDLFNGR